MNRDARLADWLSKNTRVDASILRSALSDPRLTEDYDLCASLQSSGALTLEQANYARSQALPTKSPQSPTAPKESAAAVEGPKSFGSYEVLRKLGEGGMGQVYQARHRSLGKLAAVKTLLPTQSSLEARERFILEAQALARLKHPNIMSVLELQESGAQPYMILEFVAGGSLSDRLQKAGKLPPKDAAELIAKVAEALQHAHERGVLHRDIKPANILLREDGEPVIGDFGLARPMGVEDQRLTQTGVFLGTPAYMAPEQIDGVSSWLDGRADVYALGVTLFETLTGQIPFQAPTALALARLVLDKEAPRLRSLNPEIDLELDCIVAKCLEKDRGDRYSSAAAFAGDLNAWLAGESLEAAPPNLSFRWRKLLRRNRGLVLTLVLGLSIFALVTIGLLGKLWQSELSKARQQREILELKTKDYENQRFLAWKSEQAEILTKAQSLLISGSGFSLRNKFRLAGQQALKVFETLSDLKLNVAEQPGELQTEFSERAEAVAGSAKRLFETALTYSPYLGSLKNDSDSPTGLSQVVSGPGETVVGISRDGTQIGLIDSNSAWLWRNPCASVEALAATDESIILLLSAEATNGAARKIAFLRAKDGAPIAVHELKSGVIPMRHIAVLAEQKTAAFLFGQDIVRFDTSRGVAIGTQNLQSEIDAYSEAGVPAPTTFALTLDGAGFTWAVVSLSNGILLAKDLDSNARWIHQNRGESYKQILSFPPAPEETPLLCISDKGELRLLAMKHRTPPTGGKFDQVVNTDRFFGKSSGAASRLFCSVNQDCFGALFERSNPMIWSRAAGRSQYAVRNSLSSGRKAESVGMTSHGVCVFGGDKTSFWRLHDIPSQKPTIPIFQAIDEQRWVRVRHEYSSDSLVKDIPGPQWKLPPTEPVLIVDRFEQGEESAPKLLNSALAEGGRVLYGQLVQGLAVSPDGSKIAAIFDGYGRDDPLEAEISIFETNSGRRLKSRSWEGLNRLVWSGDGSSLLVAAQSDDGSTNGALIELSAESLETTQVHPGHWRPVLGLASAKSEPVFASFSDDGLVFSWSRSEAREGQAFFVDCSLPALQLKSLVWPESMRGMNALSIFPNEKRDLIHRLRGEELSKVDDETRRLRASGAVGLSPSGARLAVALANQSLVVFNRKAGTGPIATLSGHDVSPSFCAFLDENRLISVGGVEVFLWDIASEQMLHREVLGGAPAYSVCLSPSSRKLLIGRQDRWALILKIGYEGPKIPWGNLPALYEMLPPDD